jgi:hypothetical protein
VFPVKKNTQKLAYNILNGHYLSTASAAAAMNESYGKCEYGKNISLITLFVLYNCYYIK